MEPFEAVYKAYFHDVYAYLCSLCGDASLAEELTGETFFKALQAIDRFRGDCDVRVWLCQIARNAFLSHCRRHCGLPLSSAAPDASPSPEAQLLCAENARALHARVHALPEPYREVFLLRVFGELSFADIAALFGKSANWACVTYHRARTKILHEMEAHPDET